jgi:hypothetical protein
MFTKAFWLATFERTIRTVAVILAPTFAVDVFNLNSVDWSNVLNLTIAAAVGTVLLCIAGSKVGDNPGPSMLNEKVVPVPPGK